jgi:hypothetical protein
MMVLFHLNFPLSLFCPIQKQHIYLY